jgi:O-antigen ligase
MALHTTLAWIAALFLASSVFGHTVSLRLTLLGTGILLAAAVTYREKDSKLRFLPPIWLPFLLWGAWALLSITWSVEPDRTLKEWRNEVFYTGAALWVCYVGAQARDAARIFLPVVGIAAAAACFFSLHAFSRGWEQYADGWHGGPGDHSSALLVLMPCSVMAGWYAMRAKRSIWLAATSALLAALFLASAYTSLNRTVWIGFAVQCAVLGMLLVARSRMSAATRVLAPALALAAVLGCTALLLNVQAEREAVGAGGPLEGESRLMLWPRVAERIAQRPLTGYGFGRGLLRDSLQVELRARDTNLWHAHNYFFDAALQIGLPGMLLFALLIGATLFEAWRRARAPDDWTAAVGVALAGMVAGMLVRNMTDTLLVRQNALLFWGAAGALLAMSTRPALPTVVAVNRQQA